jgi:hypothetical protein
MNCLIDEREFPLPPSGTEDITLSSDWQEEELPGTAGAGQQGQGDQVCRAVARLGGDRGGGPDAGAQQQGSQQVHRGLVTRPQRPHRQCRTLGRCELIRFDYFK